MIVVEQDDAAYTGDMAMLSEAVGTMIIVALVGSHLGMWWRCRRDSKAASSD
jgi:Na+/serine symporter